MTHACGDKRLTGRDLRVLFTIMASAGEQSRTQISFADIASATAVARGHIPEHVKRLEQYGYLRVSRGLQRSGNAEVNVYKILPRATR